MVVSIYIASLEVRKVVAVEGTTCSNFADVAEKNWALFV